MVTDLDPEIKYPRRDKCRYCGEKLGWVMHPIGEAMALGVCDKPKCQKKKQKEEDDDVGS